MDRSALLVDDILAAPASLERLLAAYAATDSPLAGLLRATEGRGRFAFSGLGSSRYAALIAASDVRAAGGSAWVEFASTSAPTAPAPDLVFVAISASGRTPEVVNAAERHRGQSVVVAVTNDPQSTLASAGDVLLPLLAGAEGAGIATRTFRATVAVLAMLAGRTPESLAPTVGRLSRALEERESWLSAMADALDGAPAIDVLADARILGLAEQAALMLREAPRLPSTAYETGDWLHTGVYLAVPGHRALLFAGAPADPEVIAIIERRGGVLLRVPGDAADTDPFRRAIVESAAPELLAAELWRRTSAEERDRT